MATVTNLLDVFWNVVVIDSANSSNVLSEFIQHFLGFLNNIFFASLATTCDWNICINRADRVWRR